MIYHITGTVEYTFDEYVEAESVEDAEAIIDERASNGRLANIEVSDFYLEDFEEVPTMEV